VRHAASTFIGRSSELERLSRLLDDAQRLVTVWGVGGIGKSRFAQEFARVSSRRSWTVDLSEAAGAEGFMQAVARALEVPVGSARASNDIINQLGRSIASRGDVLLVLDGFDHLVEAGAQALQHWLESAPEAQFVVTSRERLRLADEATFELAPMSVPAAGDGLGQSDAAALFLARVEENTGRPAKAVDPERLASLLRELEGIPLAIELAAARMEVLGVQGLLDRLPARLKLLSRGARGKPSRHATMRAAIAWSWDLLSGDERQALTAAAIFRGGFTLDAAERVLDTEPAANRIEIVEALRDKSLLFVRSDPEDGRPRFALFETVREFAMEKLLEGPRAGHVLGRHDAHYLETGTAWARKIEDSGDIHATALLARELDNLLEVHRRALALEPRSAESATRAATTLLAAEPVLSMRAPSSERHALWVETLAAVEDLTEPSLLQRVVAARGRAAFAAGELDTAQSNLARAIQMARDVGDRRSLPPILLDLGIVHRTRRSVDATRDAYSEALEVASAEELPRSEARALGNLGTLLHDERHFDSARVHYERSMARAAHIGDARIEGIMLGNLGVLEQEEGRRTQAKDAYERALRLLSQSGDRRLVAITKGNLGMLNAELGELERARMHLEQALEALREIGDMLSEGLARVRLGVVLLLQNERAAGVEQLALARLSFARLDDQVGLDVVRVADALVGIAADLSAAEQVRKAIEAARARVDEQLSLVDRSDDARAIVRLIEAAMSRASQPSSTRDSGAEGAMVIGPQVAWLRLPDGKELTLSDHEAARRVVARLVEHHAQRLEDGIAPEVLIAAGWPGEKLLAEAARNRLYVVVAWLRKQGMKDLLLRRFGGYMLAPTLTVRRAKA